MAKTMTNMRVLGGINVCIGMWLILSPFILGYEQTTAYINQVGIGFFVLLCAFSQVMVPSQRAVAWLIMAAGVWLVMAPLVIQYEAGVAYWNSIVSGGISILTAYWLVIYGRQPPPPRST